MNAGFCTTELRLEGLPDLQQAATLRDLARALWARDDVRALWLGGSLASGRGDRYSDVDLRVAVAPADLVRWQSVGMATLFGAAPVAHQVQTLGPDRLLHNVLLRNGDAYDLYVQSTSAEPEAEEVQVLGCRDETFAARLADAWPARRAPEPVRGPALHELLCGFWVNSHKHRKVIARDLDLLATIGIQHDRLAVLRLWYMAATGLDATSRPSIHTLTGMARAVGQTMGDRAMALLGADLSDRARLIAAVDALRDEVSTHGRALAARYDVEYPNVLEHTVRECWREFLAGEAERRARPG